ncbi:MAG: glycoside hydrolase family 16 protein, partial [Pseudomonadota bacterium]
MSDIARTTNLPAPHQIAPAPRAESQPDVAAAFARAALPLVSAATLASLKRKGRKSDADEVAASESEAQQLTGLPSSEERLVLAQLELPAGSAAPAGAASGPSSPASGSAAPGMSIGTSFAGLAGLGLALGGGGGGSSAGASPAGSPAAAPAPFSGQVINGYIQNALVFQDNDRDGVHDSDEPSDMTDGRGNFSFIPTPNGGPIIALPGPTTVDTSTNAPVTSTFRAPAGATVVSPLSTLMAAGLTEAQIETLFGIDPSVDLLNYDAIQDILTTGGSSNAMNFKLANVLVSNLMDVGSNLISGASDSGASVDFSLAIVNAIVSAAQAGGGVLDMTDASVIDGILTQALVASGQDPLDFAELITATSEKLAESNALLELAADTLTGLDGLERIEQIEQVVQTTVAGMVRDMALDSGTVADEFTEFNVSAAADVAVITPLTVFETLTFESSSTALTGFNNAGVSLIEQTDGNNVVKFVKIAGSGAQTYAGVTISEYTDGELLTVAPLPFEDGNTTLGMWVHSAQAGTRVRVQVADSASGGYPNDVAWVEVEAIATAAGWQYLQFDFSQPSERFIENNGGGYFGTVQLSPNVTYDIVTVFFDLGVSKVTSETYYFDQLGFVDGTTPVPLQPLPIAFETVSAIPMGYTLAFTDEFGGDISASTTKAGPDLTYWDLETGTGPNNNGWGNGESQVYTDSLDNAYVQGGTLHIVATKSGQTITSARLKSDLPDLDAYGYMEVRAKLPAESGAWPAIWLLGQSTWPDTGEIDIAEWSSAYFNSNEIQAALHFRGDNNQTYNSYGNTSFKEAITLDSSVNEFHTYQLWWSPTAIRIGVDGNINNAYFEYTKPAGATNNQWPFDNPMDLILNLAIGGTLGGAVPGGSFTYEMQVDYVRVYQEAGTTTGTVTVTFDADPSAYTLTGFGGTVPSLDTAPPAGGSGTAVEVIKTVGAEIWAGVTFLSLTSGELITSNSQSVTMRVWAPDAGTVVRLKLEDAADGTRTVETDATTTVAGDWQTLTFNFAQPASGTNPLNHATTFNKASVFFDFGNEGSGKTYYFDDVSYGAAAPAPAPAPAPSPAPAPATVVTFDADPSTYTLTPFGGTAPALDTTPPSGGSGTAVEVIKTAGAATWAGVTFLSLASGELITSTSQSVTMRVWAPDAGTVVRLKLEDAADVTRTVETDATTTVAGDWQTLTFNFA